MAALLPNRQLGRPCGCGLGVLLPGYVTRYAAPQLSLLVKQGAPARVGRLTGETDALLRFV